MKLIPFLVILVLVSLAVYYSRAAWKKKFPKPEQPTTASDEVDALIDSLHEKITILEKDALLGIKESEEKLYKMKGELDKALQLKQKTLKL